MKDFSKSEDSLPENLKTTGRLRALRAEVKQPPHAFHSQNHSPRKRSHSNVLFWLLLPTTEEVLKLTKIFQNFEKKAAKMLKMKGNKQNSGVYRTRDSVENLQVR